MTHQEAVSFIKSAYRPARSSIGRTWVVAVARSQRPLVDLRPADSHVSFKNLKALFGSLGYRNIDKLNERRSGYGSGRMD